MTADTDKLLSLARECGGDIGFNIRNEPSLVAFSLSQLAIYTERIRQGERERILKLVDAVRRVLQRELGAGEWMDSLETAIRSSGTSESRPEKSHDSQ